MFYAECLELQLRPLCAKLIRKSLLDYAKTALSLIKVDVNERGNHQGVNKVDLGFGIK